MSAIRVATAILFNASREPGLADCAAFVGGPAFIV
jgi:hypothetical protein